MLFIALLLGIIEGMTEFLPVSSTGHLILFGDILGFKGPPGKTFEIVIQLGAILAICCLYHKKLSSTAVGLVHREAKDWRFAIGILLAFLPAMVLGALLHEFMGLRSGRRNCFVHQPVVGRVVGAVHLVVIQLAQFKQGAAYLCRARALVNEGLVDDFAELRGAVFFLHD